jgi:hypothetical protein
VTADDSASRQAIYACLLFDEHRDARRHPWWTTPFETALLQIPATQKNAWIIG